MKASEAILYEMLKDAVVPLKEAIRENYKQIYNCSDEDLPKLDYVSDLLEMASDICFEWQMKEEIGAIDASRSMDS